ncbi:LamG domain-containing protein [Kineococcus sp. TRM81007]|uniref:LamG domain-containing protein n=1 Tax=Kineococcus sp. TRM81007 TaxID=2925831 RepID=UPI001F575B11|nr:LamG domain-containing protein [Kineococcus sp. TRM81007]MCI2239946.1 LamG domain-containing protein [Kineococcus sp. TRM81007]
MSRRGFLTFLGLGAAATASLTCTPSANAATVTFRDVITNIPGLKHYYPLDRASQARDVVGGTHGTAHGNVAFDTHARFDGKSYIEIPDHSDFSVVTRGALTIVAFNTIDDWRGAGASEYVHWMGKGAAGSHEWVFRHYVKGGTGEASSRQYRTSFYHFNTSGGLGAGSYFQDADAAGTERMVTGMADMSTISMWKNGQQRDSDPMSGYSIKPGNGGAPVRLGTRDMSTGFLVGRLRRVAFFDRKLTQAELKRIYDARNLPESGSTSVAPVAPVAPVGPATSSTSGARVVRSGTGSTFPLKGFNVSRTADALVAYTKAGSSTGTNQYGTEVVVRSGRVVSVSRSKPGIRVPSGSIVLSGHGEARRWLEANAKVGATLAVPKQ